MEALVKRLMDYGVLGIVVIALGYGIYQMRDERIKRDAEMRDTLTTLFKSHETTTMTIAGVTEKLEALTKIVETQCKRVP